MTDRVLVIDDDASLVKVLTYNLQQAGYQTLAATDGHVALRLLYAERPDLLILDINLPELNGWQVCERVREMSDLPIIMLTAREHDDDIVKGLDLGADDYIVKPFTMKEVLARVRATLRRTYLQADTRQVTTYHDAYLYIDLETHSVTTHGVAVALTPTEYSILALLIENQERVLRFQEILEQVWGPEYVNETGYVHTYIWRLRRKIEPDPQHPRYILSQLDVGYRFVL